MGKVSVYSQTWILPKINLILKEKYGERKKEGEMEGRKKERQECKGRKGGTGRGREGGRKEGRDFFLSLIGPQQMCNFMSSFIRDLRTYSSSPTSF